MPPGYRFRAGPERNLDETADNMILAIALASIFVYMVLVAQFESFLQPLIIMTVLPLSVPFALFTIWATGRTLNLWSALGILLLLGIVKKNSILQVDYTNVLRQRGLPARGGAGRSLAHPAAADPDDDLRDSRRPAADGVRLGRGRGQRGDIAMTIVGGQTLCLFLTLLLVPAVYVKLAALEQSSFGTAARGPGEPAVECGQAGTARVRGIEQGRGTSPSEMSHARTPARLRRRSQNRCRWTVSNWSASHRRSGSSRGRVSRPFCYGREPKRTTAPIDGRRNTPTKLVLDRELQVKLRPQTHRASSSR